MSATKITKLGSITSVNCFKLRGVPTQAQINLQADHVQILFQGGYDSMASGLYHLPKEQRKIVREIVAAASGTVESLSGSGKPYKLIQMEQGTDGTVILTVGGIRLPVWLMVMTESAYDALMAERAAAHGTGADEEGDEDEDEDEDEDDKNDEDED